jgi:hypothetical protein
MKTFAHVISLLGIEKVVHEKEGFATVGSALFGRAGAGAPVFALLPRVPQEISNGWRTRVLA